MKVSEQETKQYAAQQNNWLLHYVKEKQGENAVTVGQTHNQFQVGGFFYRTPVNQDNGTAIECWNGQNWGAFNNRVGLVNAISEQLGVTGSPPRETGVSVLNVQSKEQSSGTMQQPLSKMEQLKALSNKSKQHHENSKQHHENSKQHHENAKQLNMKLFDLTHQMLQQDLDYLDKLEMQRQQRLQNVQSYSNNK